MYIQYDHDALNAMGDLDPDFIESELIAFLTARRFYNLPITFPETTGVSKPSIGGFIFKNL